MTEKQLKEAIRQEYTRTYYQKNRDRICANVRAYYQKNRDRILERQREKARNLTPEERAVKNAKERIYRAHRKRKPEESNETAV